MVTQPNLEDWRRLDPYINRIKIIGIPPPFEKPENPLLHIPSVLQPLVDYLRDSRGDGRSTEGRSLLPNLAEVIYEGRWTRSPQYHSFLRDMLIGPSLRSLRLIEVATHHLSSFMGLWKGPTLGPTPGSLRSLTLHAAHSLVEFHLKRFREMLFIAIQSFHNLEHISFTPGLVCEDTLAHLAGLPTLTSLGVHFYQIQPHIADIDGAAHLTKSSRCHAVRFSYLHKLSVVIDNWSRCDNPSLPFLEQYVNASALEAVTLTFTTLVRRPRTDARFLERLLDYLAPSAPTLCELAVYTGVIPERRKAARSWIYPTPEPDFHFSSFPGLLRFVRLRTLRFEDHRKAGAICPVNDDALGVIADAFPDLELLSLCAPARMWGEARGAPDGPLPTLSGLLLLAQRCRNLRTLRLPVRPTFVCREETLRAASESASTVRTLSLWATPLKVDVEHPAETGYEAVKDRDSLGASTITFDDAATFFREVFPNVNDLCINGRQDRVESGEGYLRLVGGAELNEVRISSSIRSQNCVLRSPIQV